MLLIPFQGVVTSAASLIQGVVHYYADDYKGCVQLAVSRLSRVGVAFSFLSVWLQFTLSNTKITFQWRDYILRISNLLNKFILGVFDKAPFIVVYTVRKLIFIYDQLGYGPKSIHLLYFVCQIDTYPVKRVIHSLNNLAPVYI